jgi:hypothetical protein
MKWLKLILNKEFRAAVTGLVVAVKDATEDGKLTQAETGKLNKAAWRLINTLRQ